MKIMVERENFDGAIAHLQANDNVLKGLPLGEIEQKIKERLAGLFGEMTVQEARERYRESFVVWRGIACLMGGQDTRMEADEHLVVLYQYCGDSDAPFGTPVLIDPSDYPQLLGMSLRG